MIDISGVLEHFSNNEQISVSEIYHLWKNHKKYVVCVATIPTVSPSLRSMTRNACAWYKLNLKFRNSSKTAVLSTKRSPLNVWVLGREFEPQHRILSHSPPNCVEFLVPKREALNDYKIEGSFGGTVGIRSGFHTTWLARARAQRSDSLVRVIAVP